MVEIRSVSEPEVIVAAGELFDEPPTLEGVRLFLSKPGHHVLMAIDGDEAAGFITGVEMTHPDKGTEMFLYELSVHEDCRGRGIGSELVRELRALAERLGCYGMWVGVDPANEAAQRTYRRAGAADQGTFVMLGWDCEDSPERP